MITLRNVTFTYPESDRPVLDGVDLHVLPSEFLLVTGESGVGKSTLLRVPNGLVPSYTGGAFSGQVIVNGVDVTGQPPRHAAATIGFVPQDPQAHSTADNVMADIAFTMENLGIEPTVMRRRLEEVLDALSIAHLRDRRMSTLSGGERQRVAIASVLAAQPKILICDEPTSALDPKSAEDVLTALVRLRDDLGLTIICSEHRLERLGAFADRVCHMQPDGNLLVAPTRQAFAQIPHVPPVTELGRRLGWSPLPVTVREGRNFARELNLTPPPPHPPIPGGPVLVADAIKATYPGREVLTSVSMDVRAGQITALIGRNGSGKTTLLRTMAGLHKPKAGRVLLNGAPLGRSGTDRVAYVPQRADTLLFRETVEAEVSAAAGAGTAEWLDLLGLQSLTDRHPWDLSAGQRLRVALATALSRDVDVILLDEPTRGLDPVGKQLLSKLLTRRASEGVAVVLVTHDVELVALVADRVCMLGDGEIVADGSVREVLTESVMFSSQTAKVMDDSRFLVVTDVLDAVEGALR